MLSAVPPNILVPGLQSGVHGPCFGAQAPAAMPEERFSVCSAERAIPLSLSRLHIWKHLQLFHWTLPWQCKALSSLAHLHYYLLFPFCSGVNFLYLLVCFAGAERLQEVEPLCAFSWANPRGLCHQSHLFLGGSPGPECVPTHRPATAPEQLSAEGQREEEPPAAPARGGWEKGEWEEISLALVAHLLVPISM